MLWAKVYTDLCRHRHFRDKPDSYVRLALGLIFECKENFPDGVIRGLSAKSARGFCHIKAPLRQVEEAIIYLVEVGWLIPHPSSNGVAYEVKDFRARQARQSDDDRKQAQNERSATYYARHKDEILMRRKSHGVSHVVSHAKSHTKVVRKSHADLEQEKDMKALAVHDQGEPTGNAVSVDNIKPPDLTGLSDSDKAQAEKLLSQGQAPAALAFLASLRKVRLAK